MATFPSAGTPACFHALYEAHIEPLRSDLLRQCEAQFGRDNAEDFTQDTLLRAYDHLWCYEGRLEADALRPWLFTILTNVVSDHKRKTALRHETDDAEVGTLDEPSPAQRSEWWDFCRRDVYRLLRLTTMPEEMKHVILLRMENYTQTTIGILLDLPQRQVSHLLSDGLRHLERIAARHSAIVTLDSATFRRMARHCRYQRPQRRGAFLTNQKLRRLR